MSLASVVFRKTHFFEQLLFVPSRDLVKRAPVLLAAQTIEQLQALGPLVLQGGIEFGCRRHNEIDVARDLGFFCSRALVGGNDQLGQCLNCAQFILVEEEWGVRPFVRLV